MSAAAYWCENEIQPAQAREEALMAALPAFIAHIQQHSSAHSAKLRDVDAATINNRDALATLPITRKSALINEQAQTPPFGAYDCFNAPPPTAPQRYYLSPGPIAECDFATPDYWRTAAALYAAGFRRDMLLHNCFSYHFTPAGFMCDEGARLLGGRVFPAGPGNSEQQARAVAQLQPQCYSGTPDFLHTILTRADEAGLNVDSLRLGCVSGGYLSPDLRQAYKARNMNVLQWYGSADVGCIAFEPAINAPLVVAEGLIVEIIDPVSQHPCAAGEKGEVVISNLNKHFPLLRLALGDLSAVVEGSSDCGRTNMRLAGWLGRCDAAVKIKGMFVHPIQIERLATACPEVTKMQLVVSNTADKRDVMQLRCVVSAPVDDAFCTAIAQRLQDETKLRGDVVVVDAITGDIISDERETAD